MRVGLYFDAARHMRPRQLACRARRLVPPRLLAAGLVRTAAPQLTLSAARLGVDPAPQSGPTPPPDATRNFTAFGVTRPSDAADFWRDDSDGLLFLFHLHGFADLAEYAAGRRRPAGDEFWAGVISSWIDSESRPSLPAWHPYPTSNRIVAWSAALSAIESWAPSLRDALAREVWRQARYLRRAVEHDIGGNHVLRNAKALAFAGALFPASQLWDDAMRLLRRELATQVLRDGGHEERSTSYHRAVCHDLVEVAELAHRRGEEAPPWLRATIERMEQWQAALAGPDSRLPLLNDAWEGPPIARDASVELTQLTESGYLAFRHGGDQAVFDVGPLGPRHLPPHAHADALSFVLWADGRPLVVDPGSYAYTGPWRRRFRSTAAHNTVQIDGVDQCELWGDFRAAYMPTVRVGPVRRHADMIVVSAMHDGYHRLSDPVEHHRTFIWVPRDGVVIVDLLRARTTHEVRSFLHLAPVAAVDDRTVGQFTVEPLGPQACVDAEAYSYSPYLGTLKTATRFSDERTMTPHTPFGWSALRGDRRVEELGPDSLTIAGGGRPPTRVDLAWCR